MFHAHKTLLFPCCSLLLVMFTLEAAMGGSLKGTVKKKIYRSPERNFTLPVPSGAGMKISDDHVKQEGIGAVSFHDDFGNLKAIHYMDVASPEGTAPVFANRMIRAETLKGWFHEVAMPSWFLAAFPDSRVLKEMPSSFKGMDAHVALVEIPRGSHLEVLTGGKSKMLDSRRGLVIFFRGHYIYLLAIETLGHGWWDPANPEVREVGDDWMSFVKDLEAFYETINFVGIKTGASAGSKTSHESKPEDLDKGRAAIGSGDYAQAMLLLTPLAEKGNSQAQNALGVLYLNGWGVTQDHTEALKWFEKAAEQEDPKGQLNLGLMYVQGLAVAKDPVEAINWLRKSAEQDHPTAQGILGAMYATGEGVEQDFVEAMKWYRKAAEQGDAEAQRRMGFMYVNGQGVATDYIEAEKWLRKAVAQGDPGGQYWLGRLYEEGWGVEQSFEEAIRWYRPLAEQGEPGSQYRLGLMYAKGQGVVQDDAQALKWLRGAAAHGHEEAREFLESFLADGQRTETPISGN